MVQEVTPEMLEQVKELVGFLSTNKEARDQALDVILSYTKIMVQRRAFLETDIIK